MEMYLKFTSFSLAFCKRSTSGEMSRLSPSSFHQCSSLSLRILFSPSLKPAAGSISQDKGAWCPQVGDRHGGTATATCGTPLPQISELPSTQDFSHRVLWSFSQRKFKYFGEDDFYHTCVKFLSALFLNCIYSRRLC